MPDISVGMDRGQCQRWQWRTNECVAERSWLMVERSHRLVAVAKPKAAGQSRGLYDVVIQCV